MAGYITPEGKYAVESVIPCYDVDAAKRLKPSAFMNMTQEIAYLAATSMGFGYDQLVVSNQAWVLSRFHFKFLNVPHWRDKVKLLTWHKGPFGPFYLRDFKLKDENGEDLVIGTSSWIVLDTQARRMVRTEEILKIIPEASVCSDNAIETPAEKVVMPKGVEPEFAGTHTVGFSDVDFLGHTNNVRYVVWAMDCIGYEITSAAPISDLYINFNHETVAGDVVELYKYRDGGSFYVEGKVEGKSAFCVKIDYGE